MDMGIISTIVNITRRGREVGVWTVIVVVAVVRVIKIRRGGVEGIKWVWSLWDCKERGYKFSLRLVSWVMINESLPYLALVNLDRVHSIYKAGHVEHFITHEAVKQRTPLRRYRRPRPVVFVNRRIGCCRTACVPLLYYPIDLAETRNTM